MIIVPFPIFTLSSILQVSAIIFGNIKLLFNFLIKSFLFLISPIAIATQIFFSFEIFLSFLSFPKTLILLIFFPNFFSSLSIKPIILNSLDF